MIVLAPLSLLILSMLLYVVTHMEHSWLGLPARPVRWPK